MPRQSKRTQSSTPSKGRTSKSTSRTRTKQPERQPAKPQDRSRVISKRDERGVPYPGDWPNPLDGLTRGCF